MMSHVQQNDCDKRPLKKYRKQFEKAKTAKDRGVHIKDLYKQGEG